MWNIFGSDCNNNNVYESNGLSTSNVNQSEYSFYDYEITRAKRLKSTFPFGKCKVCNDESTGIHYGVATCEGCKVIINQRIIYCLVLKLI